MFVSLSLSAKAKKMNVLKNILYILLFLGYTTIGESQELFIPHFILHSHNDYDQDIPLYTALRYNALSIEVDIVRDDQRLVVSHDKNKLSKKPLLEWMYLEPLKLHVQSLQNWKLNIDSTHRWLMIDIKEYDKATLTLLHDLLQKYDEVLQDRSQPKKWKPIKIILSGDIPREEIYKNQDYKYFFIDGRREDLRMNYDSYIMPVVSVNYKDIGNWKGVGRMSRDELRKIHPMVERCFRQKKYLRFWKTVDHENVWSVLLQKRLKVIGVDDLERFHQFMQTNRMSI